MNPAKKTLRTLILLSSVFLFVFCLPASAQSEISGRLEKKINNCGDPNHKGPHETYVVRDLKTFKQTEINVSGLDKSKLKPGKSVKLKGQFENAAAKPGAIKRFKASKVTELVTAEATDGGGTAAPAVEGAIAAGAAETQLSCLLLFANSTNYIVQPATVTKIQNMLFNDAKNVSEAIKATTYGHYSLTHAATATVTLNYDAATKSRFDMEADIKAAAIAMGYDLNSYGRVLVFIPNGSESFTAYAYIGGNVSVYSYNWSTGFFDGYVHELGHNFGFMHSSRGGNQYGDNTCVMGSSNSSTGTSRYCATYNVAKKIQNGWFAPFPGSHSTPSSDVTCDLLPISENPGSASGIRAVQIAGTNYYISYARNLAPYGWLKNAADYDKVYVHTTDVDGYSQRLADLVAGGTYTAGTTVIRFERHGDTANNFATVSFDLADGNTKPVANAQTKSTYEDIPVSITLTGSDANGNPLTYAVVTNPTNGTLSGTAPNLTYTPKLSYYGTDSFVFSVFDGKIKSFATVSLTVNPTNVAPVVDAGVNQTVSMVTNTSWTPDELPNSRALWLDAADASTLTLAAGNRVSEWKDKSGNGRHVTQTTDTKRPLYNPTGFDGGTKPSIYFDGGDTLNRSAVTGTVAGQWTLMAVINDKSTDNFDFLFTTFGTAEQRFMLGLGGPQYHAANGSATLVPGEQQLAYEAATDSRVFRDGSTIASGAYTYTNLHCNGNWAVGSRTGSDYMTADTCEFIYFEGKLSDSDRQKVEGYFAHKWGLADKLAADHPYKNAPPASSIAMANLDATVTDANNDPLTLTWSKVSGPGSVGFVNPRVADTTANFSQAGTYVLRLTVNDGLDQTSDDVAITVNAEETTNEAPAFAQNPINAANAVEDVGYNNSIAGSATDPNGDVLSYAKVSGPAWLNVAPNGALTGTPTNGNVGSNSFVISVSDGANPAVEATLLIAVNNTNDTPVWSGNPIARADATEDAIYSATIAGAATDIDPGTSLTYAKVSGPAWLAVASNGTLSGTPDNGAVGSNSFVVSVSDGAATVQATLNITVINVNDAPTWVTSPIAGSGATEDSAYSATLNGAATDVDSGATLTYAKVSGPAWLTVASNGALSGTPTNSEVGNNSFTVSVTDGLSAAVQATLSITVTNTNDAPTWTTSTNVRADATEDVAYSATLNGAATDVDAGATLIYAKVSGPSWLIVSSNGSLSGTPTTGDIGTNSFTVSVSDGVAPAVQASLTINVTDAPNRAPVVNAGLDQNVSISANVWTPAELTNGRALWLDASDASTLTLAAGNRVSEWKDKSGNGRHVTQTTDTRRPLYSATGYDGGTKPSVYFDGGDTLNRSAVTGTTAGEWTLMAVLDDQSVDNFDYLFTTFGSGEQRFKLGLGGPQYQTANASAVLVPGEQQLTYEGTMNSRVFRDGSTIASGAYTYTNLHCNGNWAVGSRGGSDFMVGDTCEFIFFEGKLSDSDRQKVEGYFAHKWGLADKLAADHPYKNAPPTSGNALVNLDATVSDPDGDTLTTTWSKVSGTGSVSFANASAVDTAATFTQAGTYVLRLTASDTASNQTIDEVTIQVTAQGAAAAAAAAAAEEESFAAAGASASDEEAESVEAKEAEMPIAAQGAAVITAKAMDGNAGQQDMGQSVAYLEWANYFARVSIACEGLDLNGDGLINEEEFAWAFNPFNPISLELSAAYFDEFASLSDPKLDSDEDGLVNGVEFLLGSDPTDPASVDTPQAKSD